MAGNAISGVTGGDVKIGATQISEVKQWSFNPKSNNPAYASNKTGGYKERVAGVKDGSGSIEGVHDPSNPLVVLIDVGTEATLLLYITATQNFSVPSIIDDYDFTVNIDEGEIVGWTANFSTNGAWTNPVAAFTIPDDFVPPEGVQFPVSRDELEAMMKAQQEGASLEEIQGLVTPKPVEDRIIQVAELVRLSATDKIMRSLKDKIEKRLEDVLGDVVREFMEDKEPVMRSKPKKKATRRKMPPAADQPQAQS